MSLSQLLSQLNSLQLQNAPAHAHVVELVFPACDLIRNTDTYRTVPSLDPPKHVAHRSRPPDNQGSLGLLDIGFHAIISRSMASGLLPEDGAHGCLLKTLEDLYYIDGRSKLSFLSYVDEKSRFIYRFRLQTTTKNGDSTKRDFELSDEEVELLFGAAKGNECVDLIKHLVSRESYRAYYHVRWQLSDTYGYVFVKDEESSWNMKWASSQQTDLRAVFMAKLNTLPSDSAHGQDCVRYILPCGHELATTAAHIAGMREQDCLSACCQDCNTTFLTSEDLTPFEIGLESIRCNKSARAHAHWTKLDQMPTQVKYSFHGRNLLQALQVSLRGFMTSELVSPSSQTIASHTTIPAVLNYLDKTLNNESLIIEEMPETMIVLLIEDILKSVRCDDGTPLGNSLLPPGYGTFLRDWMLRAINFVTERKCGPPACELRIHRHKHELVYGSVAGGFIDDGKMPSVRTGKDDKVPASIETLEAELAEMDLEGMSSLHKELDMMLVSPVCKKQDEDDEDSMIL